MPNRETAERRYHDERRRHLDDAVRLLPTPAASDSHRGPDLAQPNRPNSGAPSLVTQVERLLPTPDAGVFNDNQTVEAYWTRKAREPGKGYNGNGGGTPLAMAVRLLPTPTQRDWRGRNQRDDDTCLPGAVKTLPTPTVQDARATRRSTHAGEKNGHDGTTLSDVAWMMRHGASSPEPSDDGS